MNKFSNFLKYYNNIPLESTLIIDSVQKWCKSYLKPRVINDYRNEITTRKIFTEMGDLGILGMTIPKYGSNMDYTTYGLVAKEIESIDSGYRSMFSVQSSLVMNPIDKFGSEYQKNKYLPELAKGNLIGCFGLTEPDYGSNPADMVTYAVREGENYILNGNKTWISNSPIADLALVWAKDKSEDNKIKGFLIERGTNGFETPKINGKMSLRTSITGMIHMENVKVNEKNVLPYVTGLKGPFTCLNSARLGISFGALGAARSCIEDTILYISDRKQFNGPLANKQLIQFKIANMITEYNLALGACLQVSKLKDKDECLPEMISMVKRNSCDKSLIIARTCRDILGGNGISEEYSIFRHMVNLETVNTYEGTSDIHALIMGKYFTGYSSF